MLIVVIRSAFKWTRRVIFLSVALVVLALVFRDTIQRNVVEQRIRSATGMDVKIGKYSSSLLSPVVTIEHLKLYNTPEFGGTLFLDIPELHIEIDALDLAHQRLHITMLRLNLAELNVVRNEAGSTNLFSFKNPRSRTLQTVLPKDIPPDFDFTGIDVLNLSLGKAKYVDLKAPKNNREIRVDLQNQVFKNVKSEADLYGILVVLWLRSGGTGAPPRVARSDVKTNAANNRGSPTVEKTSAPVRKE
jgi:uncharacterized protein involved in outer membrane biogenesis